MNLPNYNKKINFCFVHGKSLTKNHKCQKEMIEVILKQIEFVRKKCSQGELEENEEYKLLLSSLNNQKKFLNKIKK